MSGAKFDDSYAVILKCHQKNIEKITKSVKNVLEIESSYL